MQRVKKAGGVLAMLLSITAVCFLTVAVWQTNLAARMSFLVESTCEVVGVDVESYYCCNEEGVAQCVKNWECFIHVQYEVDNQLMNSTACDYGPECCTIKPSTVVCRGQPSPLACRPVVRASTLECSHWEVGQQIPCWANIAHPHRVAIELPWTDQGWSVFLWIPSLFLLVASMIAAYVFLQVRHVALKEEQSLTLIPVLDREETDDVPNQLADDLEELPDVTMTTNDELQA